jgi:hypothetical protein
MLSGFFEQGLKAMPQTLVSSYTQKFVGSVQEGISSQLKVATVHLMVSQSMVQFSVPLPSVVKFLGNWESPAYDFSYP